MRLYEPDDFEMIRGWFNKRNMKAPLSHYLPKLGFIEDFHAACFLVETDTPVAYLDFLISNPGSETVARHAAINQIVFNLMREAKKRGFSVIKATSQLESVAKMAHDFGYTNIGIFNTYIREL